MNGVIVRNRRDIVAEYAPFDFDSHSPSDESVTSFYRQATAGLSARGSGWPDVVVAIGLLILFLRSALRVLGTACARSVRH